MKNIPDAVVKATLYRAERGGRLEPTQSTLYSCIMMIDDINLDVRFLLGANGSLKPGLTREVEVKFLNLELAKPYLRAGAGFKLREVTVIGEGEILEVFFN